MDSLFTNRKISTRDRWPKHALHGSSLYSFASYRAQRVLFPTNVYMNRKREGCLLFKSFSIRAVASSSSGRPSTSGRKVYYQSQSQAPLPAVVSKDIRLLFRPVHLWLLLLIVY